MEIYERIRILRKNYLKMSMKAFGERLGVSLDIINNIENNRLARPEQKLSFYKLICKEYNVSEDWLLYGKEPMFVEPGEFNLDSFLEQKEASKLEIEIMKAYFELDPAIRKTALEQFQLKLAAAIYDDSTLLVPDKQEDIEKFYPPINQIKDEDNIG